MSCLTKKNHQIIYHEDKAAYVLVPYAEYQKFFESEDFFPPKVLRKHVVEGLGLIRSWREYKGMLQSEVCMRSGLTQSTLSQMENKDRKCRPKTREKIAIALGIEPDQLSYKKLDEYLKKIKDT